MKTCVRICFAIILFAAAAAAQAPDKPRVFVTESQSWEVGGAGAASEGTGATAGSGGARPQTSEIIKTFNERCPQVIVTIDRTRADYVVMLDHEGGKSWFSHKNKVALANHDGDVIFSHSTMSLGNAVKDVCEAIQGQKKPATPEK